MADPGNLQPLQFRMHMESNRLRGNVARLEAAQRRAIDRNARAGRKTYADGRLSKARRELSRHEANLGHWELQ